MFLKFKSLITDTDLIGVNIFMHHNADPDAICAAESLKTLIGILNPNLVTSIYSDGINTSSKRLMEGLGIEVIKDNKIINEDSIIITVDTANYTQLGKFENYVRSRKHELIVFDHHDVSEMSNQSEIKIYEPNAPSTCLLVAALYQSLNIEPNSRISTLLISGHLYDSRRFIHGATANVFKTIAWLLELGGNYEQANEYLQNEMRIGEKIARLKAVRRLEYELIGKYLIVTSKVSAFESSAARSIIGLGADVTFVVAKKNNETRGSARSRLDQINVGDILTTLSQEFKIQNNGDKKVTTSGGGHRGAAGLNITPPLSGNQMKKIQKRFVEIVKTMLETKGNTNQETSS